MQLWRCIGGEVKHENLMSNKLTKVKFPPWRDNQKYDSSVSPSLERPNIEVAIGCMIKNGRKVFIGEILGRPWH